MIGYIDASTSSISSPYPSSHPAHPSSQTSDANKNHSPLSDPGPRNTSDALNTNEKDGYKSNLKKINLHEIATENKLEEIKLLASHPHYAMHGKSGLITILL